MLAPLSDKRLPFVGKTFPPLEGRGASCATALDQQVRYHENAPLHVKAQSSRLLLPFISPTFPV